MKRIKLLIPVLLTVVALSSTPVLAANISTLSISTEDSISPLTEEVKWVYRTYNGVLQMRLWSITYGYWLTDWIDCDY